METGSGALSPVFHSMRYALILLFLTGCASYDPPSFQDVYDSKAHLLMEVPERVRFEPRDTSPECDDRQCVFTIEDANILYEDSVRAEKQVESLDRAYRELVEAHNSLVRALVECSYGSAQRDATIAYKDDLAVRADFVHLGKQALLIGLCAATHY